MDQVRSRIDGHVGIIELDNPAGQFMTARMTAELDVLTQRWAQDPEVRAIVITGSDPGTFITHFSVEELEQVTKILPSNLPRSAQTMIGYLLRGVLAAQRWLDRVPLLRRAVEATTPHALRGLYLLGQLHRVFSRLERMDKAVIAAVNGTAMGGGCELALACDYRLMARGDHGIGLIEVLGAIIPGGGGTQRLAATVGRARAIEMILDGTVLSADDAERIGLVTRAVDADRLMDEALTLARRLATRPLAALGHAKRAVRVGSSMRIDDGIALEKHSFVMTGMHRDARKLAAHYLAQQRAGVSATEIFDALRQRGV